MTNTASASLALPLSLSFVKLLVIILKLAQKSILLFGYFLMPNSFLCQNTKVQKLKFIIWLHWLHCSIRTYQETLAYLLLSLLKATPSETPAIVFI